MFNDKYELVCGLETHVELSTTTKIFCGCSTEFGKVQNENTCPVCLAHPGTLPKINKRAVEFAIKAGLATNGEINLESYMDRKNYFYPDLPKAYQVTQLEKPISVGGFIELDSGKKIRIHHIHLEEDAGKLVHKGKATFVDYNRGGVPLVEIVTEPDFRSADEAVEYLEKLQLLMRYVEVSDCKMQEGSLRCDVNTSVRLHGTKEFGVRSEIKNMNSFAFIKKAIEYEFERKCELAENKTGEVQETRRYVEANGSTESMRTKEDAHDYRYFQDPDLLKIVFTADYINEIKASLGELPFEKFKRYVSAGLSEVDAMNIVRYRKMAEFFDKACEGLPNIKAVSNFLLGAIYSRLDGEEAKENCEVSVSPEDLNQLVKLLESGKINSNIAKKMLAELLDDGKKLNEIVQKYENSAVNADDLGKIVDEAIAECEKAAEDVRNGKMQAIGAIIGSVMKKSKGAADANVAKKIILEKLQS